MQHQMISHPRLSVMQITGREGPTHDPYSYEEYYVKTPQRCIVVHIGLAIFVKVGSQRVDATGKDYDKPFAWADRWLTEEVGFTLTQLQRISNKAKSRCPKGGYHESVDLDGYPGETLSVCRKCDRVVDSYFCESAVI